MRAQNSGLPLHKILNLPLTTFLSSSSPALPLPSCSSSFPTPLPNYLSPLLPPLHTTTLPYSTSGAFCVLSSVLEQLKVEGIVDLFFCSNQNHGKTNHISCNKVWGRTESWLVCNMSACVLSPVGIVCLPLSLHFPPLFSLPFLLLPLLPFLPPSPLLPLSQAQYKFCYQAVLEFLDHYTCMKALIEQDSTLIAHKL